MSALLSSMRRALLGLTIAASLLGASGCVSRHHHGRSHHPAGAAILFGALITAAAVDAAVNSEYETDYELRSEHCHFHGQAPHCIEH